MINKNSAIWEGLPGFERVALLEYCLDTAERLADVQAEELAAVYQVQAGLRDDIDRLEMRVERLVADRNAAAELMPVLQARNNTLEAAVRCLGHGASWVYFLGEGAAREIDEAISTGQKIGAIKALRKATSLGLKTAKEMVEERTDYLSLLKRVKESFS